MSSLPEEYRGVMGNLQQARIERRTGELKKIQADAEQISQLIADPRWEFYGRYLEVRKKAADMSVKAHESMLLRILPLTRQEYNTACAQRAFQHGVSVGLEFALTIAQVLITQGEKAVEELKSLTSDEK